MRRYHAVTITTQKKGNFALETVYLWSVTRFPRPRMATGFQKLRNPVAMYRHLGHFRPGEVSSVRRDADILF